MGLLFFNGPQSYYARAKWMGKPNKVFLAWTASLFQGLLEQELERNQQALKGHGCKETLQFSSSVQHELYVTHKSSIEQKCLRKGSEWMETLWEQLRAFAKDKNKIDPTQPELFLSDDETYEELPGACQTAQTGDGGGEDEGPGGDRSDDTGEEETG